jgi:hypothetical protein
MGSGFPAVVRDAPVQCSIAICRLIINFISKFGKRVYIFDGGEDMMTIFLRSYSSITIKIKSTETKPPTNEVRGFDKM